MSRSGDADAALAAVLEVAFHVARLAPEAEPPFEPPAPLRPILRFTNLPATALRTLRRVLDTDAEFRARVAAVAARDEASAALVGEAGLLFVQRPEGWEQRLRELGVVGMVGMVGGDETAPGTAASGTGTSGERALVRRLEGAEKAAARAGDDLAKARERIATLTRSAADDRRRRSEADVEAAAARRELEAVVQERDELAAALAREQARVEALEAEADALVTALDAARADLARAGSVRRAVDDARGAVEALRAALEAISSAPAAMMAGIGGVATVIEALSRAYLDDGNLSADEINSAFKRVDKKTSGS